MKTLVAFICLLFTVNAFSQCADTTHIFTFTHNNKKYEVVKEQKTWPQAAACAVARGGYLVEINNEAEQKAVFTAISKNAGIATNYVAISTGGGIAYVWLGASDKKTEGTWLWDGNNDGLGTSFWMGEGANGQKNGRAMVESFYNWGGKSKGKPNEPDNFATVQHCAAMGLTGWPAKTSNLGAAGEWNDLICTSQLYYVIEYDNK